MKATDKDALTSNLLTLLSAIAKVAIEEKISHSEFSEIAKYAFVKAAESSLDNEKRITDSRISIVSGIHRKDVKRLRQQDPESFKLEKSRTNRAVSVISAWTREQAYVDQDGQPLPLPYEGDTPSLSTLVKEYSGDMPVRAVCDELERMGFIEKKDALWHLTVPAYLPNKSREAVFRFLGEETSHLVSTIHHNLNSSAEQRQFQRSVAYDELAPETVSLFQEFASERSMDLLKEFDAWLSSREKQDKQMREEDPSITRKKAGVGIYYFEETLAEAPDGDKQ
jgi:hypothetical protein